MPPNFARRRSTSTKRASEPTNFGPEQTYLNTKSDKSAPGSAKVGTTSTHIGPNRPNLPRIRRNYVKLAPASPALARIRPNLFRNRSRSTSRAPESTSFGREPTSIDPKSDKWAGSGASTKCGPTSTELGPGSTKFDKSGPDFGHIRPKVARYRPSGVGIHQLLPELGHIRLSRVFLESGQIWGTAHTRGAHTLATHPGRTFGLLRCRRALVGQPGTAMNLESISVDGASFLRTNIHAVASRVDGRGGVCVLSCTLLGRNRLYLMMC